jgi:hypothetical protein
MIDCAQLTDLSRSSGAVARRGRDRLLAFYPIALKSLEKNEGMLEDMRGIAAALNARGVRTARGGSWHQSNVRNLLLRIDAAPPTRAPAPVGPSSLPHHAYRPPEQG